MNIMYFDLWMAVQKLYEYILILWIVQKLQIYFDFMDSYAYFASHNKIWWSRQQYLDICKVF